MNINELTILPGGWHYHDKDGYRIPIKGELPNPKSVVDAIMSYRLENNIPVGAPQHDLEEYVCNKFPAWCRRGPTQLPPTLPKQGRNVDLITQWANELYTRVGRMSLVPQKEAEQRANICKDCPMQMNWIGDCPPCVTSAQRLLSILRQGRDTQAGQEGSCRGCASHGWDNRTAVHLDAQHLPPQANPNAPANCWVRR